MTAGTGRRGAVTLALLGAAAVTAPAEAGAMPACQALAVSPHYASDRTAACYTSRFVTSGTEVFVYVSRDGLRTWRKATSAGFTATPNTTTDQIFFVDRTLFLQTTDYGLLFSNDLGETFQVADALGGSPNGRDNLTPAPWAAPAPVPGFPAVEIAYGDNANNHSAMIRPPLHQRTFGSPDADVQFAPYVARDGSHRWLSLAFRQPGFPVPNPGITSLWDCDATLICGDLLREFAGTHPRAVVAAPDFGTSRVVFVSTDDADDRDLRALWRSADGGRTFAEVAPVAALRREIAARRLGTHIDTHVTFTGGRTVVLSLAWIDDTATLAPPVQQILVSSDLGATWRLVAFGRSPRQPGPRGTLPWDRVGAARVHVTGGRLFALAMLRDRSQAFCSRDGGRTWKTFCD